MATIPTTETITSTNVVPAVIDSTNSGVSVTDQGVADKGTSAEPVKSVDVQAVKAKRREKANASDVAGQGKELSSKEPGKTDKGKPDDDADTANNPGTDKTKEPSDKGTLTQFVSLRKTITELESKVKAHEPVAAVAKKVAEAEALAKSGKHYDAIRLLGFVDFDAAAREVMGLEPDATSAKSKEDTAAANELIETVRSLEKKLADKEAAEVTAKANAERAEGVKQIKEMVKGSQKDKFKHLSKSDEWIEQALTGADQAYALIMDKRKKDGLTDELSVEERNRLILTALTEGEKLRAKEAQLYQDQDTSDQERVTGITSDSRGGRVLRPAIKTKLTSVEDLKKARRARAN